MKRWRENVPGKEYSKCKGQEMEIQGPEEEGQCSWRVETHSTSIL